MISRIRDEVFPDFPTLVSTAEDELLDCSRIASWNKPPKTFHKTTDSLRQPGMKSRSSNRFRNLVEGTCFNCHQKGHLSRDCPSKVKHEVNHLCLCKDPPQNMSNPLSSLC
ncbi:hypothetical protein P9112_003241 [Eukaryota sp. TZLM1-RC]